MEKRKTMKRILLTLAAAFAIHASAEAQSKATMADVFRAMPDSILPTLTTNNRLDLVDFIESKMRAAVTDRLDAEATLDTLTADYLRLTLDAGASVELKLLPTSTATDSAGYCICVVRHFGSPAVESAVRVYGSAWNDEGTPASLLEEGFTQSLLHRPDTVSEAAYKEWQAHRPLLTVAFSLSPDKAALVARPHFPLLTGDEKERFICFLCEKTLVWDGKTFK